MTAVRKEPSKDYWERLLPSCYETQVAVAETTNPELSSAPSSRTAASAQVSVAFVADEERRELKRKLTERIRTEDPTGLWRPRWFNFIVEIAHEARSETSIGILLLDLSVERDRQEKFQGLQVGLDLVWVSPDSRGKGLAQGLVTGVKHWLSQACFARGAVSIGGLIVDFSAQAHSPGGIRLSNKLFSTVNDFCSRSPATRSGNPGPRWPVRQVLYRLDCRRSP